MPIEYRNAAEHRFILARALNERLELAGLPEVPVRFGNAVEHRRRLVRAINQLLQPDVVIVPPVGEVLESTALISSASAFASVTTVVSAAPPTFFDTGLRRLHCSQVGAAPLDGQTPDLTFTSLQAAFDALQAGDVLTVAAETFTGSFDITNAAGTAANPIWISAEVRGGTIISNYLQAAKNGTQTWTSDGSGIFSIAGSRPYYGYDDTSGEFLPGYRQDSDINATSIPTVLGPNNPSGSITVPQRGFSHSSGRIRLRVAGGVDPTGRNIHLTNGRSLQQLRMTNADNVILDGILFEGAGDTFAVIVDPSCRDPEIRNCVFDGCQFGIRADANNTLIKRCEYTQQGMEQFQLELRTLNGANVNGIFKYAKNYYTASIFGGNDSDALLEGGLDTSEFNGTPAQGVVIDECLMKDAFEGSKAGRHRNAIVRRSVLESLFDDGIEWETASSQTGGRFGTSQCHDCLFRNVFSPVSFQGNFTHLVHHMYRCVVVVDDLDLVAPPFLFKMINTPSNVNIDVYHCVFINPSSNANPNDGFGTNHWVWFAFSNSQAERIRNFFNNIAIFENDLDPTNQVANLPRGRANNVVVSPANNTASGQVQGANGVFAGNAAADMALNADFSLQSGSPARNAGRTLVGGLPDTGQSNIDAGVFPFGVAVPTNWPRENFRAFDEGLPDRWTSPGV